MIDWMLDIFVSNSDKARAITVFFTTVIALSIVFLNQHFSSSRDRRSLRLEKLELLYDAIDEYHKSLTDLTLNTPEYEHDMASELFSRYVPLALCKSKIEKYLRLYFPYIEYNKEKMILLVGRPADDSIYDQNIAFNESLFRELSLCADGNIGNPNFLEYVKRRKPEDFGEILSFELEGVIIELERLRSRVEAVTTRIVYGPFTRVLLRSIDCCGALRSSLTVR